MAEKSTDQTPARAWVEYRRKSTENCRVRPEWLTSHELTNILAERPALEYNDSDSIRRLIASEAGGKQFETDLAFLNIDGKDGVRPARFFIQAAHTTISIFGCDHFEWTGYAFSNHDSNDLDYKHLVGEIEEDEGDGNHDAGETDESDEDEDEDEDEMLNEDRFASDGMNQLLDTFSTIWDPRSYDKPTSNRQSLEDTVILKEVLQELRVHLSTTTAAWDDFSGIDGHMDFFSDIDNREAWIAIHTLQESFRKLKGLERRLSILDRHCAESTDVEAYPAYGGRKQ
ncbi:hypothetical protein J4E86_007790 [Alternaria arbusti]|uniref:uncharacterized protein n=1 Tax=Alternaria arbusti TaxID=232088 RepID=UPI002221240E|nr:uncharacterized protein J4E86_007790 [Alternaria arbusti]KAI4949835.1 hypothetical protein J4E86_007790 [Alternaria arbusti]